MTKQKQCVQNLTKGLKQPPAVILQQAIFLQYIVFVTKNHQKIRSRHLVHEFSFTDIFNNTNHEYRADILRNDSMILCGYFCFIQLLISILKRSAEQCTLQLHHTSLMEGKFSELKVEKEVTGFGVRQQRYDGDSFFIIL